MRKRLLNICAVAVIVIASVLFVGCTQVETLNGKEIQNSEEQQNSKMFGNRIIIANNVYIVHNQCLYKGNLYIHYPDDMYNDHAYEMYAIELSNGQYIMTNGKVDIFIQKPANTNEIKYYLEDYTEAK